MLQKVVDDLQASQEHRRGLDAQDSSKMDAFLAKLVLMTTGISLPFTVVVDDPGTVVPVPMTASRHVESAFPDWISFLLLVVCAMV